MPPPITHLDQIEQLATEKHDTFEVMRYMLELDDEIDDNALDALVDEVAAPIIAAIDCTQCANCCRVLDVYLTEDDARCLSEVASIDTLIDHETAALVDEWGKFRSRPCRFLHDKRCTVYTHRPETCRTYPAFTPDFRWTLADTIAGASICPIIYNVLVAMVEQTAAS